MKNGTKNAAKTNGTTKASKGFENPYRVGGGYHASVEALRTLGSAKMHPFAKIIPAVRKAMGEGWKAFAAKDGKLSADERVIMNVMVTGRKDYGNPLNVLGYEVRFNGREKVAGLFACPKAQPIVKASKAAPKAAKVAPVKATTKAKASKGKAKAAKAKTPQKRKAA